MADRFDLEQQIMECWRVVEDLKLIYKSQDFTKLTEDQHANLMLGLIELYELKFELLFNTFETLVHERKL